MTLRAMKEEDIGRLEKIHSKYYKDEFPFPDFTSHFLNALVIEDNGAIITAGGLKIITEAVAITNKDFSIKERSEGLKELFGGLIFTAHRDGFNQIHSFVESGSWENILRRHGWESIQGNGLIFKIK